MITWARAPRPEVDAHAKPEGNATDLLYLEDSVAALATIMVVCTGATHSSRPDVRALAHEALSGQVGRSAAISAVLHGWGRPEMASPPVVVGLDGLEGVEGLDGEALDRLFVDRLTAHTHASLIRSRAELVAGANPSARRFAEHAIHADDRQLARLSGLLLVRTQQSTAAVVHDSEARWSDDGGSWQGSSPATPSSPTGG
jgi:hypothetical protein